MMNVKKRRRQAMVCWYRVDSFDEVASEEIFINNTIPTGIF
jgi:hypothetical protein